MYFLEETAFGPTQSLPVADLWYFLPFGYLLTILIETPILYLGLPGCVTPRQKIMCGIWLTACTYPVVVLVMPTLLFGAARWQYLAVAETFAPVAECAIYWAAFRGLAGMDHASMIRSFAVITAANLASFGFGEILNYYQWFNAF